MDQHTIIILLLTGLLVTQVVGKRYCQDDEDCRDLGDLQCIKSMCNWGICACPRGKISRYMGTDSGFRCLKMARVGEECDTERICGAVGSECQDGVCACIDSVNEESRWGGEICAEKLVTTSSETCSDSIGQPITGNALGLACKVGIDWGTEYDDPPIDKLPEYPTDMVPNVVICPDGKHTELVNDYGDTEFVGGKIPKCVITRVGDKCLSDFDCGLIKSNDGAGGGWTSATAACVNNVCDCNDPSYAPDITGLFCSFAFGYGDSCAIDNTAKGGADVGVCDGTKGLRCGDPCDTDQLYVSAADRDLTCVCDPAYTTSGTFCIPRVVGDSCYGDQNCKKIGTTAVCKNGFCKAGAAAARASFTFWILTLMGTLKVIMNISM